MCGGLQSILHLARCACAVAAFSLALRAAVPTIADIEQALPDAPLARRTSLLLELSHALDSIDTDRALDAASKARAAATTPHDELIADARIATLQRRRGDLAAAFGASGIFPPRSRRTRS